MKFIRYCLLCLFLSVGMAYAQAPDNSQPVGKTVIVDVPQQQWEIRSEELVKIIQGTQRQEPDAIKALDGVLTEFEQKPMSRTPIENNIILGFFYVPKEGVLNALPVIVQNQILGWYDALRFGSASGQAEIVNNQKFFFFPLMTGGKEKMQANFQTAQDNPDKVAAAVKLGIMLAEKLRETSSYDRHWPTAFGLERMQCGLGGGGV